MSILSQRVVTTCPLQIESQIQFLPTEVLVDRFCFVPPNLGEFEGSGFNRLSLSAVMVGETTALLSREGSFVGSLGLSAALLAEAPLLIEFEGSVIASIDLDATMVGNSADGIYFQPDGTSRYLQPDEVSLYQI